MCEHACDGNKCQCYQFFCSCTVVFEGHQGRLPDFKRGVCHKDMKFLITGEYLWPQGQWGPSTWAGLGKLKFLEAP